MRKILTYILIGILAVSSLFVSGAMADGGTPLIRPLTTEAKIVSSSYAVAEMPVETEEVVIYPDGVSGKILIKPTYSSVRLQPGESKEIAVTVTNRGNETVSIDPKLAMQPYTENFLDDDWVTISPETVGLMPDAKQEFTVEISIPEDADLGYYNAFIAFGEVNDEEYMMYPAYGSSLELSLEVWMPPSVQIQTGYITDRVEAGNSYDYEIEVTNVGEEDISMDPQIILNDIYYAEELISSYRYDAGSTGEVLDEEAITIDAPSVIRAGQTALVKVHLEVPEGAIGSFSGSLELGIDDPALHDWEDQVQLYFIVWKQPEEPFVKEFTTSSNGTIRIEVSTTQYDYYTASVSNSHGYPSFEVSLVNGEEVTDLQLISSTSKGYVNYGTSSIRPLMTTNTYGYQSTGTTYTEIYEVAGVPGDWTLSILPRNTENFEYSITVNA